uniref:IRG-type G domain-containing protein n=1 Tax=Bicosoecida sp. CB-2014 TaxID=1486930 RepID=A0A7S1G9F0_9STRA|mmetsp:Transcript_26215/g.91180  ORF Transcript_26215/g.91180 Transcript_26215/m.91180 type:complete len:273 (+) Transcript_26215:1399-2217(+)
MHVGPTCMHVLLRGAWQVRHFTPVRNEAGIMGGGNSMPNISVDPFPRSSGLGGGDWGAAGGAGGFGFGFGHSALKFDVDCWELPPTFMCPSHMTTVALVGETGAGKSAAINALCGKKKGDVGWAATGVVETTHTVERYRMSDSVMLFDTPGTGTDRHEYETFFKDRQLHCYDLVVLVTRKRFRRFDGIVIEQCRAKGIPIIVVRTHIDGDIEAGEDNGEDEASTMAIVRRDLADHVPADTPCFVIACRPKFVDTGAWDLPRLVAHVKAARKR